MRKCWVSAGRMRCDAERAVLVALVCCELVAAANRGAVKVPSEFVLDMPYLRVSVNGSRPLWVNLDTGASHSAVDKEVAEALRLSESGAGEASGIGRGGSTAYGR